MKKNTLFPFPSFNFHSFSSLLSSVEEAHAMRLFSTSIFLFISSGILLNLLSLGFVQGCVGGSKANAFLKLAYYHLHWLLKVISGWHTPPEVSSSGESGEGRLEKGFMLIPPDTSLCCFSVNKRLDGRRFKQSHVSSHLLLIFSLHFHTSSWLELWAGVWTCIAHRASLCSWLLWEETNRDLNIYPIKDNPGRSGRILQSLRLV